MILPDETRRAMIAHALIEARRTVIATGFVLLILVWIGDVLGLLPHEWTEAFAEPAFGLHAFGSSLLLMFE